MEDALHGTNVAEGMAPHRRSGHDLELLQEDVEVASIPHSRDADRQKHCFLHCQTNCALQQLDAGNRKPVRSLDWSKIHRTNDSNLMD